jgi:hypothetical protein
LVLQLDNFNQGAYSMKIRLIAVIALIASVLGFAPAHAAEQRVGEQIQRGMIWDFEVSCEL